MDRLTVSELADEAGISPDAVRYYERIGLLSEPQRTAAGYRQYDAGAVDQVRFIKRAQRFGLRLADIGSLLEVRERGMCPCGHTRSLLEARLSELDDEMSALGRLRRDIHTMLHQPAPSGANQAVECGSLCSAGLSETGQIKPTVEIIRSNVSTNMTTQCGCGSTAMTSAAVSAEPCTCGCCGTPQTKEDRIAELRSLRDSLDQELAALETA